MPLVRQKQLSPSEARCAKTLPSASCFDCHGSNPAGSAERDQFRLRLQFSRKCRSQLQGNESGTPNLPLRYFWRRSFLGRSNKLHEIINHLRPAQALLLGLKVDSEALPLAVIQAIKNGTVNLHDPTVTLLLIKLNAVVGKGIF